MEKHQIGKEAQKKKEEGKEWKDYNGLQEKQHKHLWNSFQSGPRDMEWLRVPQVCFSVSLLSLGLHFYDQTQYPERRKDWSMFFFGIFLVSFYFWFCSTILHGGFCYPEMFAQK